MISMLYNPIDLAWIAGIIDGEGSIGYYSTGKGRGYCLRIVVNMTHEATIHRLYNLLKVGSFIRLPKPEIEHHNQQWRFVAQGKDATYILKLLQPYIFTKSEQLELGLEIHEKCKVGSGYKRTEESDDLAFKMSLKMSALNSR